MEFENDLMKKKGKQMRTVWDIPNNKGREEIKHGKIPSQKPIQLFTRMILSSSKPKNVCLIPFGGSGSECVAALRAKRHFIAFENNDEHYKIADARIKAEKH